MEKDFYGWDNEFGTETHNLKPFEVSEMTREAVKIKGPIYMRIGRGSSVETKKRFDLKTNRIVKNGKSFNSEYLFDVFTNFMLFSTKKEFIF